MHQSVEQASQAITRRTRRLLCGSTIVHLLLLLLLIYNGSTATATTGLTEITWIELPAPEPTKVEVAAPPVAREETKAAPVQRIQRQAARNEPTKQFKRDLVRAKIEPTPQSPQALEDVLKRKLDSSDDSDGAPKTQIASLVQPPKIGTPTPAGVPDRPKQAVTRSELKRDTSGATSAPAELHRVPPATRTPSVAATVPAVNIPRKVSVDMATSGAVRHLAGAQLAGQVADRELKDYEKPDYPEWAKRDGVEAAVTLRFYVLPNGRVKDNIFVEKTSGFGDFDNNAVNALRQWRFEPLAGAGDQWGIITFNFRLSDNP